MRNINYFLGEYLRERPLFLSLIRAKEAQLFQKYLPLRKPILDFGCGDGMFAKITFASKLKVQSSNIKTDKVNIIDIGLDVKDSRIEEARELGVYKKLVVYDGKRIPFPDKYFATVISNCVLEHIPKLDITLKEIYRVLKPGGIFITTVTTKNWEEYLFGKLIFGDLYKRWMKKKQVHFNLLTSDEWSSAFRKAGFGIKEEIGYLDKRAVRWIDVLHYLSIPSLITYKLIGRWILWKDKYKKINIYPLSRLIDYNNDNTNQAGNIFFALRK